MRASGNGGAVEPAAGGDASYTAKAQHALSLFANLQANMRTSASLQSSEPAAHATSETRASSATAHHTTASSSHKHARDTHGRLTSSTPAATPNAGAARFSSLHSLQRVDNSDRADDAAALPTYTDAELESLSPLQLRQQLRVAAAVTQRLHQRSRRLESEVETWTHKYAELEAKAAGMRDAGGKEGSTNERQAPSASRLNGAHSCRPTAVSSASKAAAPATASAEGAAPHARQLETEVRRLEAHKRELTRRLYAAEQTIQKLREELRIAAAASPATTRPASSPPAAVNATTCESARDKSRPEAWKGGAAAAPPAQVPPSRRDAEPKGERVDRRSNGTGEGDAAGENSVAHLRDTVRQLQRRLDLSEARAREAMQVHLDAVLLHRESTPSAVALVNAEVHKLFQLMQQQLLSNAVQHQAERARMNELLYQLQCQQHAP
ncbi:conserved hypothetical protein [Leishmania major strain Friedlin]|uniref:Uncharacterized protein n=1 Tax=Leishmania major TaxID=5664 RepID=Q4QCQ5_LEIMA|nr:conserved hypothetical protein [Leishmania major strain Friedlin]CAG9573214.1 hypothetical_protein_-_conserved [Leishmania major strain Friedlin]CAJ04340.1 conserved hypothetical protein [Leishmania major strain Friedlin]|eukprot:XP_001682893.1 conserved hypothetical protein [Leishmania major strain Friedlin]